MKQRFLLQILLFAQHVSGNHMPITRSSRVLYSGCCLWYFVLLFSSCFYGAELRVMCPVCRMLAGYSKPVVNQLFYKPASRGLIPTVVIGIFQWNNDSIRTMALGSTYPLTEMRPGMYPGVKGWRCLRLTTLTISCAVFMKCGKLNSLESSGKIQTTIGTAFLIYICIYVYYHTCTPC